MPKAKKAPIDAPRPTEGLGTYESTRAIANAEMNSPISDMRYGQEPQVEIWAGGLPVSSIHGARVDGVACGGLFVVDLGVGGLRLPRRALTPAPGVTSWGSVGYCGVSDAKGTNHG